MNIIQVKLQDGTITEYEQPACCMLTEEEWTHPLGYCWGFAIAQDEGKDFNCNGCDRYKDDES